MLQKQVLAIGLLCVVFLAIADLASGADTSDTLVLFEGENLDGWIARDPVEKSKWTVGIASLDPNDPRRLIVTSPGKSAGELVNAATPKPKTKEERTVDLYSERMFSDCTIQLEFLIAEGGNSGVYVMGEYELQIEDNYGQNEVTYQDLGAIYKVAAARVNAGKKPGQWQSLKIDFRAPRFEGERKVANARFVKVVLNGQLIQENVEPGDVTPGGLTGKEASAGPLMFQGDHGPVAYRNIRVTIPAGR